MRNLITLLTLFVTLSVYSQTGVDTIDINNFNNELINKLVFEECNKLRVSLGLKGLHYNKNCEDAAKYQAEYNDHHNILSHNNDKSYNGVTLNGLDDRLDYINPNIKKTVSMEVGGKITTLQTYQDFFGCYTYRDLAKSIIGLWMKSKHHSKIITTNIDLPSNLYGGFYIVYNKNTDTLTRFGVFYI